MTMTDPIADMLTRVRNANSAGKATVSMPSSKKLVEIARIMQEEGYVAGYEVVEGEPRATLEITLKYGEKKAKTIRGIRRISKPGLRIYAGKDELPRVADASHGVLMERVGASGHGLAGERDICFTLQFFRFVCRGRCLHRPTGKLRIRCRLP